MVDERIRRLKAAILFADQFGKAAVDEREPRVAAVVANYAKGYREAADRLAGEIIPGAGFDGRTLSVPFDVGSPDRRIDVDLATFAGFAARKVSASCANSALSASPAGCNGGNP